jgi:hypothetical protein
MWGSSGSPPVLFAAEPERLTLAATDSYRLHPPRHGAGAMAQVRQSVLGLLRGVGVGIGVRDGAGLG